VRKISLEITVGSFPSCIDTVASMLLPETENAENVSVTSTTIAVNAIRITGYDVLVKLPQQNPKDPIATNLALSIIAIEPPDRHLTRLGRLTVALRRSN
jgi:hypothetical protein